MTDPGTPCDFCGVDDATRQLRITTSDGVIHPKACAGCHDEITRVQNNWALTDHVLAHRNLTMTDLETFKRCYLTPFAGHIRLWCPDCQPPNNLIGQYPTTIYLTKIARETRWHIETCHGETDGDHQ